MVGVAPVGLRNSKHEFSALYHESPLYLFAFLFQY